MWLFKLLFVLAPCLGCAESVHSPTLSINSTGPFPGLEAWVSVSFGPIADLKRNGTNCWLGVFSAVANLSAAPWAQVDGGISGNVPNTVSSPMKFINCEDTAGPEFHSTGFGRHEVRLLNMRQDMTIALFSNGSEHPLLESKTEPLAFSDYRLPMHGHIALAANEGQMLVQWTSLVATSPAVQWSARRSGAPYQNMVVASTSSRYGAGDLCGAPANREGYLDPGFQHTAALAWPASAEPGTKIFYRFGSVAEDSWSTERSFQVPPHAGPNMSTTILLVADVGTSEPDSFQSHWSNPLGGLTGSEVLANVTYARIREAPQSQAVLHIGDISYATGYAAKWEFFMDHIEDLATRTPYMVSQGNHERDWPGTGSAGGTDSGGECGIPAEARFRMPTRSQNQRLGWYSFDMGAMHIVMLDTELPCGRGSDQLAWLETDLKSVDRSRTPWLVVTGHRPMYSVDGGYPLDSQQSVGPDLSDAFCLGASSSDMETLFFTHEVDLCLWGHVHNALATCPVYNGSCSTQPIAFSKRPGYRYLAPVHAVVGNGGQTLTAIAKRPAPWVAWQASTWGWSALTAEGSRQLRLTFYTEDNATLHHISLGTSAPGDDSSGDDSSSLII